MADDVKKVDLESLDIRQQNMVKLKEIFPAAFAEGKVDFKKLEQLLGEDVEKGIERYSFTWPGKSNAIKEISAPSLGTLKPAREESVNFDDTENLFIEADNLEALKLLQKSYFGKIKMIYIDPPYNTGKDFVYKDNFGETLKDYLEFTKQKDEGGKVFTTNPDSAGRYHSNWLNMMYPRLYLARNLLTEDGVIFISIDDNEITSLRKICDEIFSERNFLQNFMWLHGKGKKDKNSRTLQQYIVCYAKNKEKLEPWSIEKLKEYTLDNPDNDKRGGWFSGSVSFSEDRSNKSHPNYFSISSPTGIKWTRQWLCTREEMDEYLENDEIYFGPTPQCSNVPRLKIFPKTEEIIPPNIIDDAGTTRSAQTELDKIMDSNFFDNPKPHELIEKLSLLSTSENDTILDFFAGSGTTGHAILQLNRDRDSQRKFIIVQLPEPIEADTAAYKAGYANIADIAKERIRRVINSIRKETDSKLDFGKTSSELGFKVFKLDKSNFNVWDGTDPENLDTQLQLGVDRVDAASSEEDILYEVMLKDGFKLSEKPEIKTVDGKRIYSFGEGFLLVCLEKKLTKEFIKQMAGLVPKTESDATVIFLDEGFHDNDQLLVNAVEIFKSRNEKINFRIV